MQIVMVLVPLMLILVAVGLVLFNWAVKNGQYDDLDGPAHRILYDDDKDMIPDDARQDKPNASTTDGDDDSNEAENKKDTTGRA